MLCQSNPIQLEIGLSSPLNSGKILKVLKEGSTSWPHICTETQTKTMRKTTQTGCIE